MITIDITNLICLVFLAIEFGIFLSAWLALIQGHKNIVFRKKTLDK